MGMKRIFACYGRDAILDASNYREGDETALSGYDFVGRWGNALLQRDPEKRTVIRWIQAKEIIKPYQ